MNASWAWGAITLLRGEEGRADEGIAARVLESLEITHARVRDELARIVGVGETPTPAKIAFTPAGKRVLERALREALSLSHNYIGTEHILLGLVRENVGVAARILLDFDADPEAVRAEVIRALGAPGYKWAERACREAEEQARIEAEERPRGQTRDEATAPSTLEAGDGLDFDAVVTTLRKWEGREVILVTWRPEFRASDRPYRGRLRYEPAHSGADTAAFSIPTEPPDARLFNPDGVTLVLSTATVAERSPIRSRSQSLRRFSRSAATSRRSNSDRSGRRSKRNPSAKSLRLRNGWKASPSWSSDPLMARSYAKSGACTAWPAPSAPPELRGASAK